MCLLKLLFSLCADLRSDQRGVTIGGTGQILRNCSASLLIAHETTIAFTCSIVKKVNNLTLRLCL